MKKLLIIILFVLLILSGLYGGSGEVFIGLKGDLLFPSDNGYTEIYGSSVFSLGAEVGYKFKNNICIVAGFDKLKKEGDTPILNVESESEQKFISLGIGYLKNIGDSFFLRGDAGILSVSYEERAFGEEVTGSSFGFYFQGGGGIMIGSGYYLSAFIGYNQASDKVGEMSIKLGGFRTMIVFGVIF